MQNSHFLTYVIIALCSQPYSWYCSWLSILFLILLLALNLVLNLVPIAGFSFAAPARPSIWCTWKPERSSGSSPASSRTSTSTSTRTSRSHPSGKPGNPAGRYPRHKHHIHHMTGFGTAPKQTWAKPLATLQTLLLSREVARWYIYIYIFVFSPDGSTDFFMTECWAHLPKSVCSTNLFIYSHVCWIIFGSNTHF